MSCQHAFINGRGPCVRCGLPHRLAANAELAQLRADLERVTAERVDANIRAFNFQSANESLREALDEARASAERLQRLWSEDEVKQNFADAFDGIKREQQAHAETKAALEAAQMNRNTYKAELAKLQRAWALRELELIPQFGAAGWFPESVAALIRAGAGLPIGECFHCN